MTGTSPSSMSTTAQALHLANRVRLIRATERRRILALPGPESRAELARALIDPDTPLGSYPAVRALRAGRQIGEDHALRWLAQAEVRTDRRLRDLSARQRAVLAGLVLSYGSGPS